MSVSETDGILLFSSGGSRSKSMKVLALYLPQYHAIQENDEWWGKGYTEWSAVKGAEAYFKGHKQPRVPIDHWYYDLSDPDARALKKQAELARQYQVYGFVF